MTFPLCVTRPGMAKQEFFQGLTDKQQDSGQGSISLTWLCDAGINELQPKTVS